VTPDREPRLARFSEGDDLSLLGLGAVAWLDRFAAALEPRADEGGALPDELVSAALGLLSLRRTLHRWIGQIEAAPPPPPPVAEAHEGLLR
jgi:hypothetical protein